MAKMTSVIFVVILIITFNTEETSAAPQCSKKSDSPILELFVNPEINLKDQPLQINATCMATSTDIFPLPFHKMWLTRNNTKLDKSSSVYYCHKKVCNQTLHLTEAIFENETTVEVACLVYTQKGHCSRIYRTITLLDQLPTTKPPSTTSEAQVPIESALTLKPEKLSTVQIISITIGSLALLICIVIVSICIHHNVKKIREPDVIFDPICPPDAPMGQENRMQEAVVNECVIPVYPEDACDTSNIPQEDTYTVGPGLTLKIAKPLKVLGTGAFGLVVLGKLESYYEDDSEVSSSVAVKMLKDFDNPRHKKDFEKEVDSLKDLVHPNIVKLITTFSNSVNYFIIMEYLSRGNLLELLHDEKHKRTNQQSHLSVQSLYKFAFDITSGMEYLAGKKKIHRDLAARNILVSKDYTAKISDFGLARSIEIAGHYITTQGYIPLKWVALEALDTKSFCVETDVWSYGILLWEIFTLGEEPYEFVTTEQPLPTLRQRLKDGFRLEKPELCSDETYKMMQKCWADDQKKRPTFTELKHWAKPLAGL